MSWTVLIPVRFSLRNALRRATRVRMSRNERRMRDRKIRAADQQDSRIRDEEIDRPCFALDLTHEGFDRLARSDVDPKGPAAHRVRHLVCAAMVEVDDRDPTRTLPCEGLAERAADSIGPARDDDVRARELHSNSLPFDRRIPRRAGGHACRKIDASVSPRAILRVLASAP